MIDNYATAGVDLITQAMEKPMDPVMADLNRYENENDRAEQLYEDIRRRVETAHILDIEWHDINSAYGSADHRLAKDIMDAFANKDKEAFFDLLFEATADSYTKMLIENKEY